MIPDHTLAQIRDRADIVALVGEYVPLRRAGASFKGLCPFHAEKTPSFQVNPERRIFHCFGCGAGGDVIQFVMRIEGMPFPEAARRLAERTGVEIPMTSERDDAEQRARRAQRERLTGVMDSALGYYVRMLAEHPLSAMARQAIAARAVSEEFVERFQLGYAPHGFEGLLRHLEHFGHSPDDAAELGLLVRRDREPGRTGYFDRFRHRLMFPIRDAQGQVVAFSGRALPEPPGAKPHTGDPPAKYINSPETPLYKKGETLYGLHEGRVALRREAHAILCEGNFDLVKLHQFGFGVAVAPMGTAFTADQAKLLRRYVDKVTLMFDGDAAGRKAVRAAFDLLTDAGLASQVVTLPDGDDPDTFLSREGEAALRERLKAAPSTIAFFVEDASTRAVGDPGLIARAIADLGPILASLPSQVERSLWVEKVAQRFGVKDIEAVRRQLLAGVRERRSREPRSHGAERAPAPQAPPVETEPERGLDRELVGAVLDAPALLETEAAQRLCDLLTRDDLRAILQTSSRMFASHGQLDGPGLVGTFAGSPSEAWLKARLTRPVYDAEGAKRVLEGGLPRLEIEKLGQRIRKLKEDILAARQHGDEARAVELTRAQGELAQRVQELRKKPTR